MLLFPLEAPGHSLFLSRADKAGGNWVVAVHCWADEARLPEGSTCSADCWEGREGQGWRGGEGEADGVKGVRSEALCIGKNYREPADV